MMEDFLIAFEAASLLLLVAAVAAIVLAGRRRGDKGSGTEQRKVLVKADEQANAQVAGNGEGA